ncbi:MAG: hypothetical protein IJU64_06065 [Bacilli bacterium]|nr:hypothetical protein [Bacilli bacterium]
MNFIPHIYANNQWWWALVIVGIFIVIVGLVILLKRHLKAFKSDEKPKSEKEIAAEELSRILQPVEEENTDQE